MHARMRTHTLSLDRPSLDEGSARRRDLYLTTQLSQETDIPAPNGIRNRNLSKRAAADPRLTPRGHWNRLDQWVPKCVPRTQRDPRQDPT
jgi:hypothetical protein